MISLESQRSLGGDCRVLGAADTGGILISRQTQKETLIYLRQKNGQEIIALSLPKHADLINADISSDQEFVTFTERLSSKSEIFYSMWIYDIQSGIHSKEIRSKNPMLGIFVPGKDCQLLHYLDGRISHLAVSMHRKSIELQKMRGGIHLPEVLGMQYSKIDNILHVVYRSDDSTQYIRVQFPHVVGKVVKYKVYIHEASILPPELSLYPLQSNHLSIYQPFCNRFFFQSVNDSLLFVQQLYKGSYLRFAITLYPSTDNKVVSVRSAPPDIPISFLVRESLLFIFAPNTFLCLVDVRGHKFDVYLLPKGAAVMGASPCSTSISNSNYLVDLDSCELLSMNLNANIILSAIQDPMLWDVLGITSAVLLNEAFLADVFDLFKE